MRWARRYLLWYSDKVLLLDGNYRRWSERELVFWYFGVVLPTAVLLVPIALVAGLVEMWKGEI